MPRTQTNPRSLANLKRVPGPGRPKGSHDGLRAKLLRYCERLVHDPDYQAALRARVLAGTAGPMEHRLWAYLLGNPPESITIRGDADAPLTVVREIVDARDSDQ